MTSILPAFRSNVAVHCVLQGLTLAVMPVLTRSVTPEQLAPWFLWFNLVALLASLGALRYELAIVTAKTDEEALAVLVGASGIALVLAGLAGALVAGWYVLMERPGGHGLALLAATAGACGALVQCLANWNLRAGRVVFHTVLLMMPTLLTSLFQISVARLFRPDAIWLVVAGACGYGLPACIGLGLLWSSQRSRLARVRWSEVRRNLAINRRFPVFSLPFTGAVFLRERAIYGVLGFLGDTAAVSMFGLSHRLVGFANAFVSAPLRPVFFRFAAQTGISEARIHVDMLVRALSWLIVPAWTAVLIWAPDLLGFVFGAEWVAATPYLRVLSIPFFIVAASGWLDRMYDVLGEQGRLFVMEAAFSAVMVVVLAITTLGSRDPLVLTAAMGAVSLLYGWGWLAVTYSRIGLRWQDLTRVLVDHVVAGGSVVLAFHFTNLLAGNITMAAAGVVVVAFAIHGYRLVQKSWRKTIDDR